MTWMTEKCYRYIVMKFPDEFLKSCVWSLMDFFFLFLGDIAFIVTGDSNNFELV